MARVSYAVEQRLRFIDFLLFQYGYVNRSALVEYFGISVPQASADIKQYLELTPHNAVYDNSGKVYRKSATFARYYP